MRGIVLKAKTGPYSRYLRCAAVWYVAARVVRCEASCGCAWAGSLCSAGGARFSRAASAILKIRRVATRQPVAFQCCVTAVGQVGFEISSFRRKQWRSIRTLNRNRTWSSAWTRIRTRFYSHCSTQCLSRIQNGRYRCLSVCDSFQSRSLTRHRPVPNRHLCLTREKTRLTRRSDRRQRLAPHRCRTLEHTRHRRVCNKLMLRDNKINNHRCTISTVNKDRTTSVHIFQMISGHFRQAGNRPVLQKDKYIISSKYCNN